MLGLLATMSALLGFYGLTAVVVDLGGHGFVDNLRLELAANLGYLQAGLVIGPAFGALGGWWRRTRSIRASIVVGVLLMAEPLVLAAMGAVNSGGVVTGGRLPLVIRLVPGWGLSASAGTIRIAVYVAEFLVGLACVLVVWRRSPGEPRAGGVALDA
jgi:hypothetical protein